MAYTKAGPFVDGGAPYLNAAFFNNIESALAGATVNQITGWFHVDQYGAVGDGTTIDRVAIQAAITAANTAYTSTGAAQRVYFPGKTFLVDSVNYLKDDGTTVYGAVSLMLYDGVELFGPGTIKVKNNAYGTNAFYAAVRSRSGGLSNAAITGLTFDGNTTNQTASAQCSNVLLEAIANVKVNGTRHVAANGNAVMVRGTTTTPATNIEICDNVVLAASSIGLQSSQFNGLVIRGNYVANTADNGIDVYGENGTTTSNGVNFVIADNVVKTALVGIFPETVAQGTITGNMVSGCTSSGIHVNRINGQPHDVLVASNTVIGCPVGVVVTGDTGGVTVTGNICTGFTTAGVQLGSGNGNVSFVLVDDNTLNPSGSTTNLVSIQGNQAASIRIRGLHTSATNRRYDYANTATTSSNITIEPTNPLEVVTNNVPVPSGTSFTFNVPSLSAGLLTIHGTAGGAWSSIWHGVWVSDGARVDITQMGVDFTTPGQLISSVTGSGTSLTVTVATAASGSAGSFDYSIKRVTP